METVFNQRLWGDEGFSAILSMKPLPDIIKIIIRDTSPPLWNICEYLVFKIFGTNEVYIRGLAFLFFLGTVFFTYKIAAHLFNKKTAVLASLLIFLNPFFFIYAFEGRMYSIMSFGVAGSMYFFLRRRWKLYVFFTLWALYSHHFAMFILFVQGIWFLHEFFFGEKLIAKKMFKYFVIVGLGYLPWVYPLYLQISMVKGGFWLGKPNSGDLIHLIFDYLAEGIKSNITIPLIDVPIYKLALIFTFVTLLLRNWMKNIKNTLFFLSWFLIPIIVTYLISQKFTSVFYNRYLLYTIPAAMLLLATCKRGVASYITIFLVLITFSIIDYNYFIHPAKLPFREYSEYVKSVSEKRDYLINWNSNGSHHLWETKYYNIPAPIYSSGGGDLPYFVGTALMDKNDVVRDIPEDANTVGVVTSGNTEEVKLPNFNQNEVEEFNGLKYILLGRNEK